MNHDILQYASRYATPEVATVVAALVGAFAAWKTVGWGFRTIGNVLKRFSFEPLIIACLFVGGAATSGWGMARWGEWVHSPSQDQGRTDLSGFDAKVLEIVEDRRNNDYQVNAAVQLASIREKRPHDREPSPITISMEPLPPPPDLGPGVTAAFAGVAACIVAVVWLDMYS